MLQYIFFNDLVFVDIPGHLQMDVLFIHWLYFVVHIQRATSVVEPFESKNLYQFGFTQEN